jgi:hypothetical protein
VINQDPDVQKGWLTEEEEEAAATAQNLSRER